MTTSCLVSIERRRFAALIDALKLAQFALRTGKLFGCGTSDSYRIAERLASALRDAQEVLS
jgi:hypothetical protein